jgi:hypothetical protein
MVVIPNAAECWNDFINAAIDFCNKYKGKGIDYELSGNTIEPDGEETCDGITIKLSIIDGYVGWQVDVYGDFVELLQKMPTFYPDGDLKFTNEPGDDRIIFHLWHD